MTKYYRVIKDTPMWDKGAILEYDENLGRTGGYRTKTDLFDRVEAMNEYLSTHFIEDEVNKEFFERVYPVTTAHDKKYLSKVDAQALQEKMFE